MAERSKALILGTSLRAWVRIPLVSLVPKHQCDPSRETEFAERLVVWPITISGQKIDLDGPHSCKHYSMTYGGR